MSDKIKKMLSDIEKYENNNFKANVESRLENNLKQYLLILDNSYNHIADNM